MNRLLKNIFLKLHILASAEFLRFKYQQYRRKKINTSFKKKYAEIKLPPDFFLYETFDLSYEKYYLGGRETARWILDHIGEFTLLENKKVLDWGCGPGRIIRHLTVLSHNNNQIFGTDYNEDYIKWCSKNLPNIIFNSNQLKPPLNFHQNYFDVIYSISIFTHLSEGMHYEWMQELNRVSKLGAIIFTTTHGNNFIEKLNSKEQKLYKSGKLVEQKYKIEGNRLYATYQPPLFFKNLITYCGFELLKHEEIKSLSKKQNQDVWVFKKIKNIV